MLLFIPFLCAYMSDYQTIRQVIDKLHKNTPFATFYELFNSTQFDSVSSIQKKFVKLLNSKTPIKNCTLPLSEIKSLMTECFDIIKKKRAAYDAILNNPAILFDDSENYKNSRWLVFLSLVALILCLDLVYFCIRFINHCTSPTNKASKMDSKKKKKRIVTTNMEGPSMFIYSGYKKLVSLLRK